MGSEIKRWLANDVHRVFTRAGRVGGTVLALVLGGAGLGIAPTQSVQAQSQSYGWIDSTCPWSWAGYGRGPYTSATAAYEGCIAQFYLGGSASYSFELRGSFSGESPSDPPCTDPPTSLGVSCYNDIWYNYSTPPNWQQWGEGYDALDSIAVPQYFLLPTPMYCDKCNSVGHPISPGTGSVFASETDVELKGAAAIGYKRYYHSNDSGGADGVPGWRHSYDRYISTVYGNPVAVYPGGSRASALYPTPQAACTSGLSEILSMVPGWSGATAFYSNGLCLVVVNSITIATLSIYSAPFAPAPQSQPIEYDVVRDDGEVLRYPVQGGVVTDPPGISVRFALTGSGFTVTDDDDNVETYNSNGMLLSITSHSGVVQSLSYTNGLWGGVTDSFGNSLTVSRNSNNSIVSITVNGGGTVQYGYNGSGQFTGMTNLDSTTESYTYDSRFTNALTSIVDENGVTYNTWTYDYYERGTQAQDAGSVNTISLTYNTNNTVTVQDALGAQRTFRYTRVGDFDKVTAISGSQCPTCQESASTTYDGYGWVASRTDYNGNLTCYANDPVRGLELVRVEGFASGSTCPANLSSYTPASGTLQRKITTVWDATWREPDSIRNMSMGVKHICLRV